VEFIASSVGRRSYQDIKEFNMKIKNIRHDLMLNEYAQEFADSIMKLLRSNHPSLDTI
jgi:hypothetical protein